MLSEHTNKLNEHIVNADVIQAICYELSPSHGDLSIDENWYFIKPREFKGHSALKKATNSFSQFTPNYNHSPKYPFRLPGLIQLPPSLSCRTLQIVEQINHFKTNIRNAIKESNLDQASKRELIQSICPNAITLQIYRLIKAHPSPVKRTGFTWCNKNSMQRIDKKEFINYLYGSMSKPPATLTKKEWAPFVEKEIESIKSMQGKSVKIKRPLPIAPKVNVSFLDETKTVMYYSHLPIIVFGEEPAQVTPLQSYVSKNDEKQLVDYLIKRLYVVDISNK